MVRNIGGIFAVGSALGMAPVARAGCEEALAPFVAFVEANPDGAGVRATVTSNQGNGVLSASTGALLYSDGAWLSTFLLADAEGIDVSIKHDGSEMRLHHRGWVDAVTIANPTCEENVIYGFGKPIGRLDSSALYVVSLQGE